MTEIKKLEGIQENSRTQYNWKMCVSFFKTVLPFLVLGELINQKDLVDQSFLVRFRLALSSGFRKAYEYEMSPGRVHSPSIFSRPFLSLVSGQCFQLPLCNVTSTPIPPMYPCPLARPALNRVGMLMLGDSDTQMKG